MKYALSCHTVIAHEQVISTVLAAVRKVLTRADGSMQPDVETFVAKIDLILPSHAEPTVPPAMPNNIKEAVIGLPAVGPQPIVQSSEAVSQKVLDDIARVLKQW